MQITIYQAEMERAIENYLRERVNINESQKVDIDLQATRGEDGWRAVIEISDRDAGTPETEEAPRPEPEVTKRATKVTKASPVKTEEPAEEEDAEPEEKAETAPANDTDGDDAPEEDEAPADKPKRESLFGGMKTPVNK